MRSEGAARNNIAATLIKLGRHDEAHPELKRAIECNKPFGHAAEPWKTWNILRRLEDESGNPQAAAQARQQAVEAYLAYRRDEGESQDIGAQFCVLVLQAIQQHEVAEAEQYLAQYLNEVDAPRAKTLLPKLQVILAGSRDPALAGDPALDYDDVVELRLLLEKLTN